jgi:hypothetical protein
MKLINRMRGRKRGGGVEEGNRGNQMRLSKVIN